MSQAIVSRSVMLSVVTPLPAEKRVSLLGGFSAALGEEQVSIPTIAQRVVALLALTDRPISRARTAALLWPESTEVRANTSLRSALWKLRQSAPWIVAMQSDLQIAPDVAVDVREARIVARALLEPQVRDETLLPALFLFDLLPDWYDDWVILERERYRQTRLHALDALCALLVARGSYAEAVDAGLAAVAGEPLRESAQRELICAHIAERNLGEAVRQYRAYRSLLQEELGVAPSAELDELIPARFR